VEVEGSHRAAVGGMADPWPPLAETLLVDSKGCEDSEHPTTALGELRSLVQQDFSATKGFLEAPLMSSADDLPAARSAAEALAAHTIPSDDAVQHICNQEDVLLQRLQASRVDLLEQRLDTLVAEVIQERCSRKSLEVVLQDKMEALPELVERFATEAMARVDWGALGLDAAPGGRAGDDLSRVTGSAAGREDDAADAMLDLQDGSQGVAMLALKMLSATATRVTSSHRQQINDITERVASLHEELLASIEALEARLGEHDSVLSFWKSSSTSLKRQVDEQDLLLKSIWEHVRVRAAPPPLSDSCATMPPPAEEAHQSVASSFAQSVLSNLRHNSSRPRIQVSSDQQRSVQSTGEQSSWQQSHEQPRAASTARIRRVVPVPPAAAAAAAAGLAMPTQHFFIGDDRAKAAAKAASASGPPARRASADKPAYPATWSVSGFASPPRHPGSPSAADAAPTVGIANPCVSNGTTILQGTSTSQCRLRSPSAQGFASPVAPHGANESGAACFSESSNNSSLLTSAGGHQLSARRLSPFSAEGSSLQVGDIEKTGEVDMEDRSELQLRASLLDTTHTLVRSAESAEEAEPGEYALPCHGPLPTTYADASSIPMSASSNPIVSFGCPEGLPSLHLHDPLETLSAHCSSSTTTLRSPSGHPDMLLLEHEHHPPTAVNKVSDYHLDRGTSRTATPVSVGSEVQQHGVDPFAVHSSYFEPSRITTGARTDSRLSVGRRLSSFAAAPTQLSGAAGAGDASIEQEQSASIARQPLFAYGTARFTADGQVCRRLSTTPPSAVSSAAGRRGHSSGGCVQMTASGGMDSPMRARATVLRQLPKADWSHAPLRRHSSQAAAVRVSATE